jgi:hypothetical protein
VHRHRSPARARGGRRPGAVFRRAPQRQVEDILQFQGAAFRAGESLQMEHPKIADPLLRQPVADEVADFAG